MNEEEEDDDSMGKLTFCMEQSNESKEIVRVNQMILCASYILVRVNQLFVQTGVSQMTIPANKACTSAPTEMTRTGSG